VLSLGLVFEILKSLQISFDSASQAVVRAPAAGVNEGASCFVTSY